LDRFDTVTIIGVGLIGGSIGLALRSRGLARRVVGVGRDPGRLDEATRLGAIDHGSTDLSLGVRHAEVVVVCTPVTRIAADAVAASEAAGPGVLVTDAGSTKRELVAAIEAHPAGRRTFVGAHPIAGSEKKGAGAARPDLFDGRACVLTPTTATPPDRLDRARAFWSSLGCRLSEMDPTDHDRALAATSHLPHAVAAALAAAVPAEHLALAGGAYRDGTRVAGSDAALWTGIFLANRDAVLHALDDFEAHLAAFRQSLSQTDEQALIAWWDLARTRRQLYDAKAEGPGSTF
jgi:prephenate dehydrogenase